MCSPATAPLASFSHHLWVNRGKSPTKAALQEAGTAGWAHAGRAMEMCSAQEWGTGDAERPIAARLLPACICAERVSRALGGHNLLSLGQ